jgi:hypothetical protein
MSDDDGIDEDYSMDVDDFEDFDEPSPVPISGPTVPLKGRKRFMADLEEMKKTCVIGFGLHGFELRSKFGVLNMSGRGCCILGVIPASITNSCELILSLCRPKSR